jgi:uncharacterized protein
MRNGVWGLGLLVCVAAALVLWGAWVEPRMLVVRQASMPMAGLTAPIRVLVVGDLQPAGPHETPARLDVIVDRLAEQDADVILWVGDFVSERTLSTSFTNPEDTARALARLKPRLGSFAVLGNHDWWWDGPKMEGLLEDAGIRVLRDESFTLMTAGGPLVLAGVEDPVTQRPSLPDALRGIAHRAPTVLLTHTPDLFPVVPQHVDLTLAGHTHCGQVTLPFVGRPVVPSQFGQRFAAGWHGEPGHRMLVTCGIGTSIIPVRFGNPPEAVLLTLTPTTEAVAWKRAR